MEDSARRTKSVAVGEAMESLTLTLTLTLIAVGEAMARLGGRLRLDLARLNTQERESLDNILEVRQNTDPYTVPYTVRMIYLSGYASFDH